MKLLLFLLASCIMCSCSGNQKSTPQILELQWLIGSWTTDAMGKDLLEIWTQIDDSTLLGESYFINEKDTLLSERMHIQERKNGTYFSTQIADQNDGETIDFHLTKSTENAFHFRNDAHDFPQQVVYTTPEKDSLWAYIDGQFNGRYNRVDFKMKRVK